MQERYGIDLSDGLLSRRSGRWLSVRIRGLFHGGLVPSRLAAELGGGG